MKNTFTLCVGLFLMLFTSLRSNASTDVNWSLVCPADTTLPCGAEVWNLSLYGNAYIHSHYGITPAGAPVVKYNLNACGSGTITRTWRAEDPYWNWISCTQTITVGSGNISTTNVHWPADVELYGCNPNTHPDVTGKPSYSSGFCSMVGVSYSDMLFTVNAQCKKIMRTWTLMDWCATYGGSIPSTKHVQFIKIMANEIPEVVCPQDITISSGNCKDAFVTAAPLAVNPSSCGGQYIIKNNSPYSTNKGADISGTYPVGKTKVGYSIEYGCGAKKYCYINVTVNNDKPPVPICVGQVNVALMGIDTDQDGVNDRGMVDLWAKDLDWKSQVTCGQGPLVFSFVKDSIVMKRTFTCDDLGVNEVKIYVSDRGGAQSFCKVKIDVQNNGAKITPCERKIEDPVDTINYHFRVALAGRSVYHNDAPTNPMEIQLQHNKVSTNYVTKRDTAYIITVDSFINYSGVKLYFYTKDTVINTTIDTILSNGFVHMTTTNEKGEFVFDSVIVKGQSYTLSCPLMVSPTKDVNTEDLNLLTKFILGELKPSNIREYIAADVDGNGKITVEDLSLMISLIKGEISTFSEQDWVTLLDNSLYITSPESVLTNRTNTIKWDSLVVSISDIKFVNIQRGNITDKQPVGLLEQLEVRSGEEYLNLLKKINVSIAPNPTSGMFNIQLSSPKNDKVIMTIFDVTGKTVHLMNAVVNEGQNNFSVDLSHILPQVLNYTITIGNQIHTGRIVKM